MSSLRELYVVVDEQQLTASALKTGADLSGSQFETASWILGKRLAPCPLVFRHGGCRLQARNPAHPCTKEVHKAM